jgi:putative phosphoribosyl transferase
MNRLSGRQLQAQRGSTALNLAWPIGLAGTLQVPQRAKDLLVFAHASGSSRFSPRSLAVANALNQRGIATLLFDLLTETEKADRVNVFNNALLSQRFAETARSLKREPIVQDLPIGVFGASTGAAAALVAAAELGALIKAVVSCSGPPDLASDALERVRVPTLLIVGGAHDVVIELNQGALQRLKTTKELKIVAGATHLFPAPGALQKVIEYTGDWFERYVTRNSGKGSRVTGSRSGLVGNSQ